MAVPADVIAGEIIEADWGNTIRDFACFGIEMGGASESVQDTTLTTTFETGATGTFTLPADWLGFSLMAWGTVGFQCNGDTSRTAQARIQIGASNGSTSTTALSDVAGSFDNGTIGVRHGVTGLTATTTVNIQYATATAGGIYKMNSMINYIAIRTS